MESCVLGDSHSGSPQIYLMVNEPIALFRISELGAMGGHCEEAGLLLGKTESFFK